MGREAGNPCAPGLSWFKPTQVCGSGCTDALPVTFHAYAPNAKFRKSDPGPPDSVVVVCRYDDDMPTHESIVALAKQQAALGLRQGRCQGVPPDPDGPMQSLRAEGWDSSMGGDGSILTNDGQYAELREASVPREHLKLQNFKARESDEEQPIEESGACDVPGPSFAPLKETLSPGVGEQNQTPDSARAGCTSSFAGGDNSRETRSSSPPNELAALDLESRDNINMGIGFTSSSIGNEPRGPGVMLALVTAEGCVHLFDVDLLDSGTEFSGEPHCLS